MQIFRYIIILLVVFSPLLSSAQTSTTLFDLFAIVGSLANSAIPIVLTLGLVIFLWGLVRFMAASGNEQAIAEGKRLMVWGVITLFVMVSVWGLVAFITQITGVTQVESVNLPSLNSGR
jgi:hypothetical protein